MKFIYNKFHVALNFCTAYCCPIQSTMYAIFHISYECKEVMIWESHCTHIFCLGHIAEFISKHFQDGAPKPSLLHKCVKCEVVGDDFTEVIFHIVFCFIKIFSSISWCVFPLSKLIPPISFLKIWKLWEISCWRLRESSVNDQNMDQASIQALIFKFNFVPLFESLIKFLILFRSSP